MIKDCCKDKDNLKPVKQDNGDDVPTCQVCGCRHFEFAVDPVKLFATVSSI